MMALSLLLGLATLQGSDARVLQPSFANAKTWRVSADQPWWALVDMRDMLNVFQPYSVSRTGATAGASAALTIPTTWQPPFALRFFCADDYFADTENHKPGKIGTESFFEHRSKQVLIDGKVAWERDVTDENTHGSPTTFTVDVTPFVTPGKPFTLTFRVLDKVSPAAGHSLLTADLQFQRGWTFSEEPRALPPGYRASSTTTRPPSGAVSARGLPFSTITSGSDSRRLPWPS
jgi:hypothetical protein